jgi:hypothetical protein
MILSDDAVAVFEKIVVSEAAKFLAGLYFFLKQVNGDIRIFPHGLDENLAFNDAD